MSEETGGLTTLDKLAQDDVLLQRQREIVGAPPPVLQSKTEQVYTRSKAIGLLPETWKKRAARHEDYRGIQTCIRDLEDALKLPIEEAPPALQALLKDVNGHLTAMKGKSFQFAGDPTWLLSRVRDVLTSLLEAKSAAKSAK